MEDTKKRAIKQLKKIRDTGKFNMFMDRQLIISYANKNDMYSLVSYCGNDFDKYIKLLEEDWSKI
jgi:hypothetical protein